MSKLLAGRYELVDKIGEGGMAVVYRAKDRLLNRFVAIKVLRPEYTRDEQFVESFKRESQAAAGLQHPNIVAVYDVGKTGNINYIVMELVDGRPLSEVISEKAPMDYSVVIDIGKQMASALSLAHKHQIIHRDVKPHNILVNKEGVAKLTDFGIAKAITSSTVMGGDTSKIIGSVHYFSPEQARGSYVDERSDIYSLGIVLYEMLTGKVPFDGDNPVEVALKHINEEITPPSNFVKGIPPALEKLVMKATDKFQTNRYKSADEMLEDLKNVEFSTNIGRILVSEGGTESINSKGISKTPIDPEEITSVSNNRTPKSKDRSVSSGGGSGKDNGDKGKNRLPILMIVLGLAAIALLMAVIGVSGVLTSRTSEIKVPDLTNKTYEEARAELEALKLEINRGDDISSDTVEAGKVAQQMPIAGSNVKEGKIITVRISSGHGDVLVPDVKEKTFDEAKAILEEAGFVVSQGEAIFSETVAEGLVVNQLPAANSSAKFGETVVLALSKGAEDTSVVVPNLIGTSYTSRDEMDTYLAGYKLKLGEVIEIESGMTPGSVVDQSPGAGVEAEKDAYVDIYVAIAPETVTVPSLTGMTLNEAIFICEDRGLVAELGDYVEDPTGVGTPGTIIRQSLEPGGEVYPGSIVVVYVIKDSEPTPEPTPEPDTGGGEEGENTSDSTEEGGENSSTEGE